MKIVYVLDNERHVYLDAFLDFLKQLKAIDGLKST